MRAEVSLDPGLRGGLGHGGGSPWHPSSHGSYRHRTNGNYSHLFIVGRLLEVEVVSSQGQAPYYLHDVTLGYVCTSLELVTS